MRRKIIKTTFPAPQSGTNSIFKHTLSTERPRRVVGKVKVAGYKPNLEPFTTIICKGLELKREPFPWQRLGGSPARLNGTDAGPARRFLCAEAATGPSLGFRSRDKEGAFPRPGVDRSRELLSRGNRLHAERLHAERLPPGASLSPEPPGRSQLRNPVGWCPRPTPTPPTTCCSGSSLQLPRRFGSRTGPVESHPPLLELASARGAVLGRQDLSRMSGK